MMTPRGGGLERRIQLWGEDTAVKGQAHSGMEETR